jgi:hypothetical protein
MTAAAHQPSAIGLGDVAARLRRNPFLDMDLRNGKLNLGAASNGVDVFHRGGFAGDGRDLAKAEVSRRIAAPDKTPHGDSLRTHARPPPMHRRSADESFLGTGCTAEEHHPSFHYSDDRSAGLTRIFSDCAKKSGTRGGDASLVR